MPYLITSKDDDKRPLSCYLVSGYRPYMLKGRGNMKRILGFLAFLFVLVPPSAAKGFSVGGSLGYYFLADPIYKETYGSGSLIMEGFFGYDLPEHLEIRAAVGYFTANGKMTLTREEIRFRMVPVVIGVRVKPVKLGKLDPYLGIGLDFCAFKETARPGNTSDSTTGFQLEAGTYIALAERFQLDINLRYIKADAKPLDEVIRLGGWRAGVGLGYAF
jgi:opacity protein-like surface antigen